MRPSPEAIRAWAVSSAHSSMALSREEQTVKSKEQALEAELDRAYERYDQAEKDRNHWHDKAQEYRQQSAEYRESRDKWCEVAVREQLAAEDTLPRVITADELKEGQTVAFQEDVFWGLGKVVQHHGKIHFAYPMTGRPLHRDPQFCDLIVLLADAPDTKDINVAKETVKGGYPDNPWFATVYEDGTYLAGTWRGTPVRPQSIRAGDLYDIHTAHGTAITGVVAARNGVRNPQNGDQYRLVNREGVTS